MSELSISELRRLDLTLLLVFLGLLRHRKALDVAAELGLTQSAISQSLRRLRDIFDDELFLRRPHGMEPTATALALEAPVAAAVYALRGHWWLRGASIRQPRQVLSAWPHWTRNRPSCVRRWRQDCSGLPLD